MVVSPPGKFRMGFDGGEAERYEAGAGHHDRLLVRRRVREITNAQYRAFSKNTKRVSTQGCYALAGKVGYRYEPMPGKGLGRPGYGRPIPRRRAHGLHHLDRCARLRGVARARPGRSTGC